MSKDTRIVQQLIEVTRDAKHFYDEAAVQAENPSIERTFREIAGLRSDIIMNLSAFIREHGQDPDKTGTIQGEIVRLFDQLLAKVANDTDLKLVEHLEEAEDKSLQYFTDAMTKAEENSAKELIDAQVQVLRKTHNHMYNLQEELKTGV